MHRARHLLIVALIACATRVPRSDSASAVASGGDVARVDSGAGAPAVPLPADSDAARASLDSLERTARALAHAEGCTGAGECRTAPLGAKACGGPRDYVVYCARTTDTVALFRTLAALERAERAYNAAQHVMSTCEMRLPPVPTLVGGRCTAGSGGNAGPR